MRNWDLFKEMDQLHREINGLFNGHHRGRLFGPAFEPGLGLRQYPKINLRDDADNVYVEALLPGVDPDGIDMNILGNTLTLTGERPPVDEPDDNCTWHVGSAAPENSFAPLNCRSRLSPTMSRQTAEMACCV